ncbi:MAG: glycosyltransferase family 39 protein [bacterium]
MTAQHGTDDIITRRETGIVLAAVAALACFLLLPVAFVIPARDSGVFLYIGQSLLRGEVPYRDVWDHKPPLIYLINALGLGLAGGRIWGTWLLELLSLSTAGWLSYRLLRSLQGRVVAALVTLLWMLTLPDLLDRGNLTEEYSLPLQFGALYLALRHGWRGVTGRWYLGLGILTALAFLLRQNHVATFAAIVLVTSLRGSQWRRPFELGSAAAWGLLGMALVLVPAGFYFLVQDAWGAMWEAAFRFNLSYTAVDLSRRLQVLGSGIERVSWSFGALLVWLLVLVRRLARKPMSTGRRGLFHDLVLIGVPLEMAAGSVSGRAYSHYFILWLPLLAVAVAELFGFLWQRAGVSRHRSVLARGLMLALVAAAGCGLRFQKLDTLYTQMRDPGADAAVKAAVKWITQNTNRDDRILMYGAEARVLALSGRRSATRYVYQYPLVTRHYGSDELAGQFLDDLRRFPPLAIFDTNNALFPPLAVRARASWRLPANENFSVYGPPPPAMDAFYDLVEREYRPTAVLEGWTLYQRHETEIR